MMKRNPKLTKAQNEAIDRVFSDIHEDARARLCARVKALTPPEIEAARRKVAAWEAKVEKAYEPARRAIVRAVHNARFRVAYFIATPAEAAAEREKTERTIEVVLKAFKIGRL